MTSIKPKNPLFSSSFTGDNTSRQLGGVAATITPLFNKQVTTYTPISNANNDKQVNINNNHLPQTIQNLRLTKL
jgi:hypothetical protein